MRSLAALALAFLAVLTAACGSAGIQAYEEEEENRMVRQGRLSREVQPPSPELVIDLKVRYVDDILLPAGTTVRGALYDESLELKPAISSNAVTTREERGEPIALLITYPRDQIDDSHEYLVRGEITDPDGVLLFTTEEPIQIIPNEDEPQEIEILLIRPTVTEEAPDPNA